VSTVGHIDVVPSPRLVSAPCAIGIETSSMTPTPFSKSIATAATWRARLRAIACG